MSEPVGAPIGSAGSASWDGPASNASESDGVPIISAGPADVAGVEVHGQLGESDLS